MKTIVLEIWSFALKVKIFKKLFRIWELKKQSLLLFYNLQLLSLKAEISNFFMVKSKFRSKFSTQVETTKLKVQKITFSAIETAVFSIWIQTFKLKSMDTLLGINLDTDIKTGLIRKSDISEVRGSHFFNAKLKFL